MLKVDLHTHSYASPDGSLTTNNYAVMLHSKGLDAIAVTDHDTINAAQALRKKFGEAIIVGEEISTQDGDIIGLYLSETIAPGLNARETAQAIHLQGGLVYIPHPFETVRRGLKTTTLDTITDLVDIIETHNGRALFHNRSDKARAWAEHHHVPTAAASDAHGWVGWGSTYSCLAEMPIAHTLPALLAAATHVPGTVGLIGALYPKFNRVRKIKP